MFVITTLKGRCRVASRAKRTKMDVSVRSLSSSRSSTPARWRDALSFRDQVADAPFWKIETQLVPVG